MKVFIDGTSVELVPENEEERLSILELSKNVASAYDAKSETQNVDATRTKFDNRSGGGIQIFFD